MAVTPRLDLRQSQQLVVTTQLRQAIALLSLSNAEVEAALAEAVANNPLLSFEGDGGSAPARPEPSAQVPGADALIAAGAGLADAPLDWDAASESGYALGSESGYAGGSDEGFDWERVACGEGSLCEHLMEQARRAFSGPDLHIAAALIDAVEETGYLGTPLPEIAAAVGVPLGTAERVLTAIHGFDPPGIAARSLAECLALQARAADRYDPAMARLLGNLDLLARGDLRALRRICGVDEEDLADMIAELRGYDPKPGCRFEGGGPGSAAAAAAAVVPDLFVRRQGGAWTVELNGATLPRLLVDRRYHARLEAGGAQSRRFAAECMADAGQLLRALNTRAQTILTVGIELVRRQEAFFTAGASALRPLTMAALAESIGVHETTVGRIASAKYLSCERGLFPLRFFFGSGVAAAEGDGAAAEAVKSRIRALVGAEDAPLSDDALAGMLAAQGFALARRTVAKYREACGIGSSAERRRRARLSGNGKGDS